MVTILQDRNAEMELRRQRPGSGDRFRTYGNHPTARRLDRSQLLLQLDELLLTGASTAALVEVDNYLRPPELIQRARGLIGRFKGHQGRLRADREASLTRRTSKQGWAG